MRIEVLVDESAADLSISITCKQLTPQIEKLLATLRMMDHQLPAKKNGETHLLDISQVIYIEAMDRKCFVYTADEFYESDSRNICLDKTTVEGYTTNRKGRCDKRLARS